MGRGHNIPAMMDDSQHAVQIMIDITWMLRNDDDEDGEAYRWLVEDLIAEVEAALPDSFAEPWRTQWIGEYERVLFENGHALVTLQDNGLYAYLTMRTNNVWYDPPERMPLAEHYISQQAPKLWDHLAALGFDVNVVTGPYTSRSYEPAA